jgi:hypothetical protein
MVRTRRVSGATVAGRPRRHVLRGPGYFKRLGPGIVTGAADDDPSGGGQHFQHRRRRRLHGGRGQAAGPGATDPRRGRVRLVMIVLEVTVPYHRYARVLRWLAVPVLAGSTAYAIAETAGWREGLGRRVKQARAFYEVIAAGLLSQPLVGAAAVVMAALSVLAALSALAVLP